MCGVCLAAAGFPIDAVRLFICLSYFFPYFFFSLVVFFCYNLWLSLSAALLRSAELHPPGYLHRGSLFDTKWLCRAVGFRSLHLTESAEEGLKEGSSAAGGCWLSYTS